MTNEEDVEAHFELWQYEVNEFLTESDVTVETMHWELYQNVAPPQPRNTFWDVIIGCALTLPVLAICLAPWVGIGFLVWWLEK